MLSLPTVPSPAEPEIPLYTGNIEDDLRVVSRSLLAERITGGLSQTSKMPCPSWNISAIRCKTGRKLAQIAGTVCHSCYALRGNYQRKKVFQKQENRFRGLVHPLWVPSMVFLIRWRCRDVFRWFDAGDVLCGAPHNAEGFIGTANSIRGRIVRTTGAVPIKRIELNRGPPVYGH